MSENWLGGLDITVEAFKFYDNKILWLCIRKTWKFKWQQNLESSSQEIGTYANEKNTVYKIIIMLWNTHTYAL